MAIEQPGIEPQPSGIESQPSGIEPQPSGIEPQPSGIEPQPSGIEPQPSGIEPQPSGIEPQPLEDLDCQQSLMSDIFVCVSSQGVDFNRFLLMVGEAAGKEKEPEMTKTTPEVETTTGSNQTASGVTSDGLTVTDSDNDPPIGVEASDVNATADDQTGPDFPGMSEVIDGDAVLAESTRRPQRILHGRKKRDRAIQRTVRSKRRTPRSINVNTLSGVDNSDAFRNEVCSVQRVVMQCAFESAKSLLEDPACSKPVTVSDQGDGQKVGLLVNDQRYLIKEQVEDILGQYDVYCAHPCRQNLLDDMRTCYEEFDLDPKIFMSRDSGGAVIGSSYGDVDTFCKNREPLVQCLMSKRDECPESEVVLEAIGLDLELMDRGFDILCANQQTYLQSLVCFESHTSDVGYCHSVKHRKVVQLASLAHQHNWTLEKYLAEICTVRLEHIQCDLDAWALKGEEECDESTFDLKRKLHCALLPPQCQATHQQAIDDVCQPQSPTGARANSILCGTTTWLPLVLMAMSRVLSI